MTRLPLDGGIPKGHVSNEPLREAFERSGLSACELARHLGYYRYGGSGGERARPDLSTVRRALGFTRYKNGATWQAPQRYMKDATARRYAEALGLDPHEVGL